MLDNIVFVGHILFLCVLSSGVPITFCSILCVCVCVCLSQTLGTPTERTWPGITKNHDFVQARYPVFPAEPLSFYIPRLDNPNIIIVPSTSLSYMYSTLVAQVVQHQSNLYRIHCVIRLTPA